MYITDGVVYVYKLYMYFVRYGKEEKLVNLFGVMQALVSIVQDDKDNLRLSYFIGVSYALNVCVYTVHSTQLFWY